MKKVSIAVDSFKGCIDSGAIADAIEQVTKDRFPECEVVKFSIADGGEGMALAVTEALGGIVERIVVSDPLGYDVEASYGLCEDGKLAIIEMAAAAGLTLVAEGLRNPELTTSYGVGQIITHAFDSGCREFIIGIGGSATNDAGMGMLGALGFRFWSSQTMLDPRIRGCDISLITAIDSSLVERELLEGCRFLIASDVDNPFCGSRGAARVYARQKGADIAMIERLEQGMESIRNIVMRDRGIDLNLLPGAGAAGGMGGGAVAYLNAELRSGIDLVIERLEFAHKIKGSDLVITGEGRMDRQTLMGKAPLGVMKVARDQGIRVVAFAGCVEDHQLLLNSGFDQLLEVSPRDLPLEIAMQPEVALANIKRVTFELLNH